MSDSLKDLIARLLTKNPDERITMAEIKEHEWVTRGATRPLLTDPRPPVTVTEDEVKNSITSLYKLDTLVSSVLLKPLRLCSFLTSCR